MSSPAESNGGQAQQTQKHGQMPVDILFCPECSNMLYPKEDKEARKLMYQCRTCQHTQQATSNCVYRNILKNQAGDTAGVTQDVALDPTVGTTLHNTTTTGAAAAPSSSSAAPASGPAALAMCGCCGQVIMCSDCDAHPAYFPAYDRAAVSLTAGEDHDLPLATPPPSYQAELVGPMLPASDVQVAWDQILDEISNLNIVPGDMDMDTDTDMDMDYDMECWEEEMDEVHEPVYGPPNKPIFA